MDAPPGLFLGGMFFLQLLQVGASYVSTVSFLKPSSGRQKCVEVEQITGVSLGYWMIPVSDGIAQDDYWLSQIRDRTSF